MRNRLTWLMVVVALVALGAAACSSDDDSSAAAATPTASEEAHDDDADAHEDGDDHDADTEDADHEDGDDDHELLALFDEDVDETVTIEMQDIEFAPVTVTIHAGELVELVLDNTGAIPHDFTIATIDADHAYHDGAAVDGHDVHGDEFAMHHALEGGDASEMRLRVHEPGEYEFWCTVPGHREAGMVGTLIVE